MTTPSSLTPAGSRVSVPELLSRLGPVIGLIIVLAIFSTTNPRTFLTYDNFTTIFYLTAVVATGALGMTLIIIAGGIDLSVGSTIALVTVIVSQLLYYFASGTFYLLGSPQAATPHAFLTLLAALAGISTAALIGLITGLLVTKLKLPPFIVTLGLWSSVRGVAKILADDSMVRSPPSWLNQILKTKPLPDLPADAGILSHIGRFFTWIAYMPWGVWLTAFLAILIALMLRYTRFGRHIYAVGSNEATARLCGVRVDLVKTLVYILGGALVGIAGVLQFSFVKMGDPTTAAGKELNIIAAVVVGGASLTGGRGSILGTILGALIMSIVDNGCNIAGVPNSRQEVITGAIIILAVAVDQLLWRSRR